MTVEKGGGKATPFDMLKQHLSKTCEMSTRQARSRPPRRRELFTAWDVPYGLRRTVAVFVVVVIIWS